MQHADFSAELEVVFAFDPAHGIIQLIYVVGELRVAAGVKRLTVRATEKFNAWESGVIYPSKSDLCRESLAEAVRDFAPETPAKSDQELVDHRWTENVVVAKARIPSTLRRALSEDRSQARDFALEGIVVVKAARNPLLVRDDVINLEVPEICSRFCGPGTSHIV